MFKSLIVYQEKFDGKRDRENVFKMPIVKDFFKNKVKNNLCFKWPEKTKLNNNTWFLFWSYYLTTTLLQ